MARPQVDVLLPSKVVNEHQPCRGSPDVRYLSVSTVKSLMGDANHAERTFAALSKEARIR